MSRLWVAGVVGALVLGACAAPDGTAAPGGPATSGGAALPPAPPVTEGAVDAATQDALEHRFWLVGRPRPEDLDRIEASGDLRLAWPLVDLLRFEQDSPDGKRAQQAIATLTGVDDQALVEIAERLRVDPERPWVAYSELLLAWDVPAPPDYLRYKAAQHRIFDQRWDPFFDPESELDWRQVSWGGVARDGIRDLIDPTVVPADAADHLAPDDIVFGVEVDGEARAYPRRIVEVHEVVNDQLGGTRIVLPFCTLCGVATVYLADLSGPGAELVEGPLEFGTSGLLFRSNKLMHDRQTESLFEQFTGSAVTGPLAAAGAQLERLPMAVTSWEEWRAAHPDTTVLALPEDEDPAQYDGSFLDDQAGDTPAFPTGDRDHRLDAKTQVLGVETPDGGAVAFPSEAAREALMAGETVEHAGVRLELGGGGIEAFGPGDEPLVLREAFWFAWSQFQPDSELWPGA